MSESENTSVFLPDPLDDDWSRWLLGRWQGRVESSAGAGISTMTIELGLNGQFLIFTSSDEITEMTDQQAEHLKSLVQATDDRIERFRSMPFREMQMLTIDPKTDEWVGYLFDSLRCIAEGRGRRDGNRLIMAWRWSAAGQGASTTVIEKIDDNTFMLEAAFKRDENAAEEKGRVKMVRLSPRL